MNIGFDLDKIFIDTPPMIPAKIIDKLYKKRDNGVLLYRIPSYPEQIFRRVTHLSILRPPIKDNMAFLRSISKKDNKLYLISSRFKFLEGTTNRVIKKHQLNKIFDGMYFNFENKQPHMFKSDLINKLKLDYFIDDDLSLIKYAAKHNEKTKFFWLNYNKENKPITKNIFAINNLSEIFKFNY